MARGHVITPRSHANSQLTEDEDMMRDAARMVRATQSDVARARRYFFMWAVILAMHEHTIPGAVFEKMARSAPSLPEQRNLVARLTQLLREDEPDGDERRMRKH